MDKVKNTFETRLCQRFCRERREEKGEKGTGKGGRKEWRAPRFLRMPGKASSSYLAPFKRSDHGEITSPLVSLSPTSLHGLCQDQMHVREPDWPLGRPTKMAGKTFSRWSTNVNKDALFVTATLSSITHLFDRPVGTTPKRRNRWIIRVTVFHGASSASSPGSLSAYCASQRYNDWPDLKRSSWRYPAGRYSFRTTSTSSTKYFSVGRYLQGKFGYPNIQIFFRGCRFVEDINRSFGQFFVRAHFWFLGVKTNLKG